MVSGTQKDGPSIVPWSSTSEKKSVVQAIRRSVYPRLSTVACGRSRGIGESTGRHVHHSVREPGFCDQADELPCHVQVFNQGIKSHRDLPLRLAEFGSCHRNEASGTLHGLMRVRNFVPGRRPYFLYRGSDPGRGFAFCRSAVRDLCRFRFHRYPDRVSTRPEQRVGSDECGTRRKRHWRRRSKPKGLSGDCNRRWGFLRAQNRFLTATAWNGFGSAVPYRWTSPCRAVWMQAILPMTTAAKCR